MTFPNQKPISQHDLILFAEGDQFSMFDQALEDSTSYQNDTRNDYDFTQSGHIILATPKKSPGVLWAVDTSQQGYDWIEDAKYDASTGTILDTQTGFSQTVSAGTCPSCHATGVSGSFCNSCGGSLQTTNIVTPGGVSIQIPPGVAVVHGGPGGFGTGPAPGGGMPGANMNRMTSGPASGPNKKPVIVPAGMTHAAKDTKFEDALDALFGEGKL